MFMALKSLQRLQIQSLRALVVNPPSIGINVRMASLATYKAPKVENENNVGRIECLGWI